MEIHHAHRDHITRDFHNKIDSNRQRDSGLRGMMPKGDPTATAHKWRQEFSALPLPKGIKEMGMVSLTSLEAGTKIGKWLYKETHKK